MLDSFNGVRRGLGKASRRKEEFEQSAKYFIGTNPFSTVAEEEGEGMRKYLFIKIKQTKRFPDHISDLAQDVLEVLRSVLDQSCYASAEELVGRNPKYAYFPFSDEESGLDVYIKGRCKSIHPDVIKVIKEFHPTESGNNLLWRLNKARVQGVHKFPIDSGCAVSDRGLEDLEMSSRDARILNSRWDDEKRELKVVRLWAYDAEFKGRILFEPYIRFTNAGPLTGYEVGDTLNKLFDIVSDIVMRIEAKTAGIKSTL